MIERQKMLFTLGGHKTRSGGVLENSNVTFFFWNVMRDDKSVTKRTSNQVLFCVPLRFL